MKTLTFDGVDALAAMLAERFAAERAIDAIPPSVSNCTHAQNAQARFVAGDYKGAESAAWAAEELADKDYGRPDDYED